MEQFLISAGYLAIIVFGFVEACCIPISSEITFGFAGVLAYEHHLSLPLVIIIGTLAELAGGFTSYAIGRKGGRPVVDRVGKYLLLTRGDIDRAERLFAGRGSWSVAVGRVLPVIRAFTGLVSGLIEVPVGPFGIFNLIGTAVYVTALSLAGYAAGSAWGTVSRYVSWAGYVLVILVVAVLAAGVLYRLRAIRRERSELTAAAQATEAEQVAARPTDPGRPAASAVVPADAGPNAQAPRPRHRRD